MGSLRVWAGSHTGNMGRRAGSSSARPHGEGARRGELGPFSRRPPVPPAWLRGGGSGTNPPPGQHRRGFVLGAVPAPSVPCSFLQPAALGTMARGRAKAAREQRASPEGRGHRAPLSCLLGTAPRGGLRAQQCLGFVAPGMLARPHVHPPGAWLLPKECGWAGAGALLAKQPGRVTPVR